MLALVYGREEFFMYKKGLYKSLTDTHTETVYPVKLIGWGEGEYGYPYWIVEATLGENWGIKGCVYIDAINEDLEIASLSFSL